MAKPGTVSEVWSVFAVHLSDRVNEMQVLQCSF